MLGVALLLAALSFGPGLAGPFVFDDGPSVAANEALRRGDLIAATIREPADPGSTLAGRPVARASLALNRLLGGHSPVPYRVGNLLLHAGTALLLFGLLRRLLERPARGGLPGRPDAPVLAADEPSTLGRASTGEDNKTQSQFIPTATIRQPPGAHAAVRHSRNLR